VNLARLPSCLGQKTNCRNTDEHCEEDYIPSRPAVPAVPPLQQSASFYLGPGYLCEDVSMRNRFEERVRCAAALVCCQGLGSWRQWSENRRANTSCICGGTLSDNLLAGYRLVLQAVRDRRISPGLHDEVYTLPQIQDFS
jgi:hypothetical protein